MIQTGGPSRLLAAGLLALVAALGVLAGVILDRTVLRPNGSTGMWTMHDDLHGPGHPASRGELREHLGKQIAADLDLSADQRAELLLVLRRHEQRMARALADARPELRRIIEEIHEEIRAILTPQQRERFEHRWMARHRELFPDEDPEPPATSDMPDG